MRSRVRYGVIAFLIASVPIALMLLNRIGEGSPGESRQPVWQMLAYAALEWYPFAIAAPFVDRRVRRRRPGDRAERLRYIAGHALFAAGFWLIHTAVVQAGLYVLEPDFSRAFVRALRSQLIPTAILYTAMTASFTVAEARRRQTEVAERLRAEVAEARLTALRQQLNPHFLFNTLNHIVSELRTLKTSDVEPALRMLLALSDLLRDVLRERAHVIPLRDEVRMVERYLEIERARFADRLQAEVTFEPKALDALVPSLMLQPLLENAMRHGVSAVDGRCRLQLTVRTRDDRIHIEVRDAGPGMDPVKSETTPGVGLRNTVERLKYLYGDDHTFALSSVEGGGLLVAIDLPFRRS